MLASGVNSWFRLVSACRAGGIRTRPRTNTRFRNRGCHDDVGFAGGGTAVLANANTRAHIAIVIAIVAAAVRRGRGGIHTRVCVCVCVCGCVCRCRCGIGLVEVMQLVEDARLLFALAALLHAHLLQLLRRRSQKEKKKRHEEQTRDQGQQGLGGGGAGKKSRKSPYTDPTTKGGVGVGRENMDGKKRAEKKQRGLLGGALDAQETVLEKA